MTGRVRRGVGGEIEPQTSNFQGPGWQRIILRGN